MFFLPRQFFLELLDGFRVIAGDPALAYGFGALLVIIGLLSSIVSLLARGVYPVPVSAVSAFRVVANGETAALL